MRAQKLEIKHCRDFIQAFLLRSVFVMKIKFLWPEVLEAGGPEKRYDRPCVGSRPNACRPWLFYHLFVRLLLIILQEMTN